MQLKLLNALEQKRKSKYHHLNYSHYAHLAACLNRVDFQQTERESLKK